MANRRKSRSQRKKVVSHSIKTGIAEEFRDLCDINKLCPSNVLEELIEKFNKDMISKS